MPNRTHLLQSTAGWMSNSAASRYSFSASSSGRRSVKASVFLPSNSSRGLAMSSPDLKGLANLRPVMQRVQARDRNSRHNRKAWTLSDWDHASAQPVFDVLSRDVAADCCCELCGAAVVQVDSFLDPGFLGHGTRLLQSSLQDSTQTRLHASPAKSFAMRTIGEQAKEFREARKWSVKEMAAACKTSRQNIETLEAKGNRTPRYIKQLAHVMGTTIDVLMEGRYRLEDAGGSEIKHVEAAKPTSSDEASNHPDDVIHAIEVIARLLSTTDKVTRSAIASSFSLLATEPDQLKNVVATVRKLLPARSLARTSQDDQSTGLVFKDLGSGDLSPDGKSTTVQGTRRRAK